MQVFWKDGLDELIKELEKLSKETPYVDLKIMSSSLDERAIYSGANLEEAKLALQNYVPTRSDHDVKPALLRASTIVNELGLVVLVTDHDQKVPQFVQKLLIGKPLENIGFTGFSAKQNGKWFATIKNHATKDRTVSWQILSDEGKLIAEQSVSLKAGELKTIKGVFPPQKDRFILQLPDDPFQKDNRIYAVKPQVAPINLRMSGLSKNTRKSLVQFLQNIPEVHLESEEPDFFIRPITSIGQIGDKPGLYFLRQNTKAISGQVLALDHALVEGINWQGLDYWLPQKDLKNKKFFPILNLGNKSLLSLRETKSGPQIICHFEFDRKEIATSSSMMVFLFRCIQQTRYNKLAYQALNIETNSEIRFPALSGQTVSTQGINFLGNDLFRTETASNFFSISILVAGKPKTLVSGGTFYADASEGDLLKASSANEIEFDTNKITVVWEEGETFKNFLILLTLLILIYSWWWFEKKEQLKKVGGLT